MINPKLSLKLNQSNFMDLGPFTPLDQTMSTPVDAPGANSYFQLPNPSFQSEASGSFYSNPQYNESDDILTDIDEPSGSKSMKLYCLSFTPVFDQLVMSVYSFILSKPTTTPFTGVVPPSGLVSKVANETMSKLMFETKNDFHPQYDFQSVVNYDYLKDQFYQPIFLQLIRKRLIDLCTFNGNKESLKLPPSTSVSVAVGNANGSSIYGTNVRQSSISNLSLTDANVSTFTGNNNNQGAGPPRSRSSSLNLRKQSLTRNNSYSGSNWLHIGNLNNIKPMPYGIASDKINNSTDSLQSMQDFVPQSVVNKTAPSTTPTSSSNNFFQNNPPSSFNPMMMNYNTPPTSHKGLVSSTSTLPSSSTAVRNQVSNVQVIQNNTNSIKDDFNISGSTTSISRSSSKSNGTSGMQFVRPLTINTESANFSAFDGSLDSPFMSATTPSEECGYFMNSFGSSGISGTGNNNVTGNNATNGSFSSLGAELEEGKINIPAHFSLSEKKRESLKMKRGIH